MHVLLGATSMPKYQRTKEILLEQRHTHTQVNITPRKSYNSLHLLIYILKIIHKVRQGPQGGAKQQIIHQLPFNILY